MIDQNALLSMLYIQTVSEILLDQYQEIQPVGVITLNDTYNIMGKCSKFPKSQTFDNRILKLAVWL